jgi:GT2 family glycosyltransferase
MTATYSIPQRISESYEFRSKPVSPQSIKVVIPTFNDWDGLRTTLDSLLDLEERPGRICVADDNDGEERPNWLKDYPVEVVGLGYNSGPAVARNLGFGFRADVTHDELRDAQSLFASLADDRPKWLTEGWCEEFVFMGHSESRSVYGWNSDTDWVYFTDCGCRHDRALLTRFRQAWEEYGDSCVAISGPVLGVGSGMINEFMTEQGILNPPLERTLHGVYLPQAIVTANTLVACLPFAYVSGFDPGFTEAAGEDLDLGIRLRQFGLIGWASEAFVRHEFAENEDDFRRRFRRYGRGNRRLEIKQNLPSLRARPFRSEKAEHQHLADLAVAEMQAGYDEVVDVAARGRLSHQSKHDQPKPWANLNPWMESLRQQMNQGSRVEQPRTGL